MTMPSEHLTKFPKLGDPLTPQESRVLAAIVEGHTDKETARVMNLSPRTVETYRNRIKVKIGARRAVDIVRIVLRERESATQEDR